MPVSSCSAPIGRWIATQCSLSCSCSAPSTRKKSARSRSSMLTNRTRERSLRRRALQLRAVCTSTPITPLTTNSAPSTTRMRGDRVSDEARVARRVDQVDLAVLPLGVADARGERHVSSLLVLVPVGDRRAPPRSCPSRFVAPAWNSIASTSDVFPVPRCPTTATLRIFPGSWAMHPPRLWCSVWPIDDLSDSPARAEAVRSRAEIAILSRTRWTENVSARCAPGSHSSPRATAAALAGRGRGTRGRDHQARAVLRRLRRAGAGRAHRLQRRLQLLVDQQQGRLAGRELRACDVHRRQRRLALHRPVDRQPAHAGPHAPAVEGARPDEAALRERLGLRRLLPRLLLVERQFHELRLITLRC